MERIESRTDQVPHPRLTCAHYPVSRSDREIAIRSDCLQPPDTFLALPPLRQQLFLGSTEGGRPVIHSASAIIDAQRLRSEETPHGERWGARLARLGLLLVHCLLRPFLASSPSSASHLAVDTRLMRRLEPQPSTSSSPHSPTKSLVAAVFERLSMEMPTAPSDSASPTNSSSEPSPQAADTKPKSVLETKRAPSPSPSLKLQMKEPVPEQDQAQVQQEEQEQEQDDVEELKQTLLRKSTGSIAIMTRQQEAFDHRRHTFSAMSADGRANMRRRSYDLTAQFGSTFPPSSPPQQPLPHSLKAHHHLQHLRVYGKSTGPTRQIGESHEEGAPMIALMTPNPDTVWTRGKPVDIEWKVLDSKVEKLCIELLEDGLSATTLIAKEAPNTGFFIYHKVPWGMESGSKYFLRVSAADTPDRFRTSSYFQISSAP